MYLRITICSPGITSSHRLQFRDECLQSVRNRHQKTRHNKRTYIAVILKHYWQTEQHDFYGLVTKKRRFWNKTQHGFKDARWKSKQNRQTVNLRKHKRFTFHQVYNHLEIAILRQVFRCQRTRYCKTTSTYIAVFEKHFW